MKKFVLIVCLLFATAGCADIGIDVSGQLNNGARTKEIPVANLPVALRQRNYLSPDRSGSCTHSCTITLLRWMNRPHTADWWRANHSGGETYETLSAKLDQAGIRYVMTAGQNDTPFLEWALATRRGCGVTVLAGKHMVCLVWLDDETAGLLDPNEPDKITYVPRNAFLKEWELSGSWAITPVYSPVPAMP